MDPNRCQDPTHRSYTADKDWDACQEFARQQAAGLVSKVLPMKAARGSAVDDAVMAMVKGDPPVDVEEALRKYAAEYRSGDVAEQDIAAALAQVTLFERAVLPTLPEVYATQFEVHWDVDGIPYHAHLDLVYVDGSIDDLKAPDQRLGEHRADNDEQLTTYASALLGEFGHLAPRVGLIALVNAGMPADVAALHGITSAKDRPKPWLDRQTSTRSLDQLATWAEQAKRREASRRFAKSTGIYQTQARTSPYGCNGCAARNACPAWRAFEIEREAIVASAA